MNFSNRNIAIALLSIILSIWIESCVNLPTDLKAPEWNVDLNVPLVNRSYTLDDIIKTQKYITAQGTSSGDSIYVIQSDTYSQSANVSNFIRLTGQTSTEGNNVPAGYSGSLSIFLPIPGGAQVDNAVFTSGFLTLSAANPNLEDANLSVTFPGILKNGVQLKISMFIPASQRDSVQTSLAGYTYKIPADQSNRGSIQIIVSSGPSSLPLFSFVTLDIYSSDFSFKTATGNIPAKTLGIQTQSFPLNLGSAADYRNKATLKYGTLNIKTYYNSHGGNHFGIRVKNLNIIGTRNDGTQLFLKDSTGSSNLTFDIGADTTFLTFNEANSNITSLISFLPDKIVLSEEYIMNPNSLNGTVTDQDSVMFSTNFSSKSVLAIKKSLITDTASINFADKDSLKIRDAKSAYVNVNIQNGIPLDSWLTISFVDAHYKPLFTLTNSAGSDSIYFAAANVNSAGEVTSMVTTNNVMQLDSIQTNKLSRARYAIYSVAVQTSNAGNGQFVNIRPNNFMRISVYGGIKYHVNTDDLK